MNINIKCSTCSGDGLVPIELSGGSVGAPTTTCPRCLGSGVLVFGTIADLDDILSDLGDKLDDVLDKCSDIMEKLNE